MKSTAEKIFESRYRLGIGPNQILAADFGKRQIGLAVIDSSTLKPTPFCTLQGGKERLKGTLIQTIQKLDTKLLIIGWPHMSTGERGRSQEDSVQQEIQKLCTSIEKIVSLRIEFEDEYLSTQEAIENLVAKKRKRGKDTIDRYQDLKRSGKIDSQAACVILTRFLDRQKVEIMKHG